MSTSLTTKTALGLMPLALGIVLRHYYERVIKDKSKSKEGAAAPVPLRLEELVYDEAFTISRVSASSPRLSRSQIDLNHLDRISWRRQQSTFCFHLPLLS